MKVEIDMKLPSFNEYVNLCRTNKYKAARFKRRTEDEIMLFLGRLPRFEKPVKIDFLWIESNKRRDLDNVCFAKKFILDALVKSGKITDDNSKYVQGFTDRFEYGDQTKVVLDIQEVGHD